MARQGGLAQERHSHKRVWNGSLLAGILLSASAASGAVLPADLPAVALEPEQGMLDGAHALVAAQGLAEMWAGVVALPGGLPPPSPAAHHHPPSTSIARATLGTPLPPAIEAAGLRPVLLPLLALEAHLAAGGGSVAQDPVTQAWFEATLRALDAWLAQATTRAEPSHGGAAQGDCLAPTILTLAVGQEVAIGHEGPDCYPSSGFLLTFDPGGDDVYPLAAVTASQRRVSMTLDLGGDDRYTRAAEADRPGVALILDAGGDDLYGPSDRDSLATAWNGGVALLADLAGDDRYFGGAYGITTTMGHGAAEGQGSVAVLWDRAGNDLHTNGWWATFGLPAQGAGRRGGTGVLADVAGDDGYFTVAWAQGFAEDGTGLLVDGDGDDSYSSSHRGNVSPWAWAGHALFLDLGGTDRYHRGPGSDDSRWGSGLQPGNVGLGIDCDPVGRLGALAVPMCGV